MKKEFGKMIYLEDAPSVSSGAPVQIGGQAAHVPSMHGANKYYGDVAKNYDAKREKQEKWIIEQRVITEMLSELPAGSIILDCPVGTMRFADVYHERKFKVMGVDASVDMLAQADLKRKGNEDIHLTLGDIRHLDKGIKTNDGQHLFIKKDSFDAAVMIRITRYLNPQECQMALQHLMRLVKDRIIFTARVRNHPHARDYEVFKPVIDSAGWEISRDVAGESLDYRIIEIRPKNQVEPVQTDNQTEQSPEVPPKPRMKRWDVLTELVSMNSWTIGAEVGVYNGYNAFFIMKRSPDLSMLLVDNWDQSNDHYKETGENAEEVRAATYELAKEYEGRAYILDGNSAKMSSKVEDGTLDFVFIDASHETDDVVADIRAWMPKVRRGGMVLGHDIDWPSVQKAVYEMFKSDWREYPDHVWGVEVK